MEEGNKHVRDLRSFITSFRKQESMCLFILRNVSAYTHIYAWKRTTQSAPEPTGPKKLFTMATLLPKEMYDCFINCCKKKVFLDPRFNKREQTNSEEFTDATRADYNMC